MTRHFDGAPVTQLPYVHLRKELHDDGKGPVWPSGIRPAPFEADRHVRQAHDLLTQAYRHGGGRVGTLDEWWSSLRADPEYDPSMFFIAVDENNRVVGLAQCWTSAFLKDLVVSEAWRRKGVGEALMLHAFATFRSRGATHLDLKVEVGNPAGAERLYYRIGMKPVA